MSTLSARLRSEKLQIERSIFSLSSYKKNLTGMSEEQIRNQLDSLQTKKIEISQQIEKTESRIRISSEQVGLGQDSSRLYEINLGEMSRLKRQLDKRFKRVYGAVKTEFEKAALFGSAPGFDSISMGGYFICLVLSRFYCAFW